MRALLILIALTITASAVGAETLRLPTTDPSSKTLPLKGATGSGSAKAKANACAAFGRGFVMVEGTCVKVGGSARIDAVGGR